MTFTVFIALFALYKAHVLDTATKESVQKLTAEITELRNELQAALGTIDDAFAIPELRAVAIPELRAVPTGLAMLMQEEIP